MTGYAGGAPAAVIDMGSGFTKMGFAGQTQPQFTLPTVIANSVDQTKRATSYGHSGAAGALDADFCVGEEAYLSKDNPAYLLSYPMGRGRVENWDDVERYYQACIFRYLRCSPEEHPFVLTEPPLNPPENREMTAEIMFETFNVPALNISVQAVLALYGQWVEGADRPNLTGCVVDSGDGSTQIIPIAHGMVIGSCIREIPLGGRQVTEFVADMLKDRSEPVPPECRLDAARTIKEKHAYICKDLMQEYLKFDQEPDKKFKQISGKRPKTGENWTIDVGYERFLAPELFFQPEIFSEQVSTPLPVMIDSCIQGCPIDCRRQLYGNIVLSGGSTCLPRFLERLQRDVSVLTTARLQRSQSSAEVAVKVVGNKAQKYAAWFGGSVFAALPTFGMQCRTKQEYEEVGASVMRHNAVSN